MKRPYRYLYLAIPALLGIGLAAFGRNFFSAPSVPLKVSKSVDSGLNVILITWDGVRIDEFLGKRDGAAMADQSAAQKPLLEYFWRELAPTGQVYGDPRRQEIMTIANPAFLSLPAYQSIFSGTTQPCQSNDCAYIEDGTFPERLVADLRLKRREVATIASWEGLIFAVEERPGHTFVNAGPMPLNDQRDAEELLLNEAQQVDAPPWADSRYDRYTWRQAMRYLRHNKPRFLYISLDDADGWGHQVQYEKYTAALDNYDRWLNELVRTLRGMGDYGRNTCLIVTTDHGRGRAQEWTTHSNGAPYSGLIVMYAGCPLQTAPMFRKATALTTHLDIRPTVEALFGLDPVKCAFCGSSLTERRTLTH